MCAWSNMDKTHHLKLSIASCQRRKQFLFFFKENGKGKRAYKRIQEFLKILCEKGHFVFRAAPSSNVDVQPVSKRALFLSLC